METACGIALPIELVFFKAKLLKNNIRLWWETASEYSNEYFIIEHSTDGYSFSEIGKLPGNGTASDNHFYEFVHTSPSTGDNYYRLKQVDFEDTSEYSYLQIVHFLETKVLVYPNPTNDFIKIAGVDDVTQAVISNSMERMVKAVKLNDSHIDLSDLPSGIYFISIQTANQIVIKRIVLNKPGLNKHPLPKTAASRKPIPSLLSKIKMRNLFFTFPFYVPDYHVYPSN